uniref:Uncharacterized protein n=2 Tax=Avena sativa TaxID=4498 RepID=A0ACD5W5Q7_AVESA
MHLISWIHAAILVDDMSAPTSIPSGSESARGNINGVDRLSSLCDELLHHVMSFLPMPEVVRTSLLSPRWRNLWASTPFIHIDDQDFLDENHPSGQDDEKLEMFGDNLLLLRDGAVCLDEARIYITHEGERKCSVWIRHAIKHKVRLLHVYGSGIEIYPFLDSTGMFPSQHLKIIRLHSLELTCGFFRPLNNDCHVLENLELKDCNLCDPSQEISSVSLKVLRIVRGIIEGLLICARNLTNISIIYPNYDGAIVTRDLSSLVTASVIINSHQGSDIIVGGHRLLDGLSHATTLELHAPLHEVHIDSLFPDQ